MHEILTAAEMKNAEAAAMAQGITGLQLMTAAGATAAREIVKTFKPCPVLVLCGPGNNGGDGFIVAQHLKKAGWTVRIACLVKRTALKNDAAAAAKNWDSDIEGLNSNLSVHQTGLIIDAVFGTGFDRALDPEVLILFDKIRTRKIPVVAIDIPTGINATTGTVDPGTLKATSTITFCRKKIAHVLLPAKNYCGIITVTDIGITDEMVANTACSENNPSLWQKDFPVLTAESHKFKRGHAIVYGGEKRTGAACLAAAAAQKIGAGLVTIVAPEKTWAVYSSYRASIMVDECNTIDDYKAILRDIRCNTVLLGPGAGADDRLKQAVEAALSMNKSGVLDADVFSAYHGTAKELFAKLSPKFILTPHEGEFEKLFGVLEGSKPERTLAAAKMANAIVVLKGADTVIAAPDGNTVINTNAPPTLATAGSGDVLGGIIAGLIAQGMPPFPAACAGVWLHGQAARIYGAGLTAEDIITGLPAALTALHI
jgi:hydroxyethylthiazole kinase-like uncharacterized protein yjeF